MTTLFRGLVFGLCLTASSGCSDAPPDPTKRPGFVDTSDPSKVRSTMEATPKSTGSTSLGGKKGTDKANSNAGAAKP